MICLLKLYFDHLLLMNMSHPFIHSCTQRLFSNLIHISQTDKARRERESRIPLYAGICAKSCQHCKVFVRHCPTVSDYYDCGYKVRP